MLKSVHTRVLESVLHCAAGRGSVCVGECATPVATGSAFKGIVCAGKGPSSSRSCSPAVPRSEVSEVPVCAEWAGTIGTPRIPMPRKPMRVLPGAAGPSACALHCNDARFQARVLFDWWCCGLLHGVLKPLCMQCPLLAES